MPNKRTGPDYQDYQKKKQAEAQKRQVDKHNKAMDSGWADLRSRIKKDKEKQKKNRKNLPYKI